MDYEIVTSCIENCWGELFTNCLILGSGKADKISQSWNQTGHFYKPDKITIAMRQTVITGFNNFYQKKNCGGFAENLVGQ